MATQPIKAGWLKFAKKMGGNQIKANLKNVQKFHMGGCMRKISIS